MMNFKSILLLCLVFTAGAVVGVVGTRSMVRHAIRQSIAHPEQAQRILETNISRRLRLDNDQQARLQDILANAHLQLRKIRMQTRPQTLLVISNVNSQISSMLTPEQARRYERLKKQNSPALQFLRQIK